MIIPEKQYLEVPPRQFWLKNRIRECISALQAIEQTNDWDLYLEKALHLANEIKYAATEWEKCYPDHQ